MAMNKQRKSSNLINILSYDDAGNIVLRDYSQTIRYNWNGTIHAFTGPLSISSIAAAVTDTDRFLVSDGGVLKYRTGAEVLSDIGAIGGSGATGQVAYWNGTNSQTGSNNLFSDAANARLGIGTNAPARALDVSGEFQVRQSAAIGTNGTTHTFAIGALSTDSNYVFQAAKTTNDSYLGVSNQGFSFGSRTLKLGFNNSATIASIQGTRLNVADDVSIQMQAGGGNLLLGLRTDSGQKFQVQGTSFFSSNIALGSTAAIATRGISNRLPLTGGTIVVGYELESQIASSVTGEARGFSTFITQQTTGNLSGLVHYWASSQSTFGGTVTNQYGYFADSSIIGASNNFGFYGNIPSGTGRWNLYMAGTADNYLAGSLNIGIATPATSAILQMNSTTRGFLPPRLTTAQRDAITSPATGLQIYNTSTNANNYYDGTAWVAPGGGGGTTIYSGDGTLAGDRTVTMNGNSLQFTGSDYITRVFSTGRLSINRASSPLGLLHIQKPANNTEAHIFLSTPFPSTTPTSIVFQNNDFTSTGIGTGTFSWNTNGNTFNISNALTINSGNLNLSSGNVQVPQNFGYYFGFGEYIKHSSATFSIDFFTNAGTQRMRLTNAGRLLLGTTTESTYLLDVNGTARVNTSLQLGGGQMTLSYSSPNAVISWSSAGWNLVFGNSSGTNIARFTANDINISDLGSFTSNNSSILTLASTTKGFLPPRMTTTQKNAIGSPAAGLVVYDTDTNKLCCYNGTSWNDLF